MAEDHSDRGISAFDCDVLRRAFKKSVIEGGIPEDRWQSHAIILVRELTGYEHVDSALLAWILRK